MKRYAAMTEMKIRMGRRFMRVLCDMLLNNKRTSMGRLGQMPVSESLNSVKLRQGVAILEVLINRIVNQVILKILCDSR